MVTDLPWDAVKARKRGRAGNPARRLAVWLLANRTDLTDTEIGQAVDTIRAAIVFSGPDQDIGDYKLGPDGKRPCVAGSGLAELRYRQLVSAVFPPFYRLPCRSNPLAPED